MSIQMLESMMRLDGFMAHRAMDSLRLSPGSASTLPAWRRWVL
jgi:hypothetical protein